MYSGEIAALFEKLGIRTGDTISITRGDERTEGMLMPRSDAGDRDIIVIKRRDGYNVGIRYSGDAVIERLSQGSAGTARPQRPTAHANSLLPNVALLYTGGTIGSKLDYVSGGVYMLTKPEELLGDVPELSSIANMEVSSLMSIASEDITHSGWQEMANGVAKAFEGGSRGVVITHGTDSMHYTSAALSFMLQDLNGPVIITGSQRSSDRGASDAFMNLVCSAHLAAKSDFAEVGICMHHSSSDTHCSLIRGTKARKMHTSRRDAFRAINGKPVALVDQSGRIEYKSGYKKSHEPQAGRKTTAVTKFEEKVALVKAYPNSDPGIIDYYKGNGYKGIVIEAMGLGHVPTPASGSYSWISHIKGAVDSGMVVGVTSQCLYGRVNPSVYRNLRMVADAGAVYCEDMLPEVAYVKLGFLLGNHKADKARDMLNKNIAGEITDRTEFEEDYIS